MLVNNRD